MGRQSFEAARDERRRSPSYRLAARALGALDDRTHVAGPVRKQLKKVFPEHWSFMLGEIALYSLVVLLLTGTFLTFFYDPSDAKVLYDGAYLPMHDVPVSKAFASTLSLSFDVRGGLVIRQIHHWAALMFFAAIAVHMMRIFFTGAFRKPREMNWVIGVTILAIAVIEGFAGYSLPDDLLSGSGLRVGYSIVESIPVIGTWLAFLIFGGPFPGHQIFQRLYIAHVLLLPGLIIALVAAHLTLVIRQKHTDFAGVRRTESTVAGEPLFPVYAMKSGGFFLLVAGAICALGGMAQINPIWLWGPYEPAQVSSNSQPDFFAWFLEGSVRLFPPWEIRALHHDVPPLFWSGIALPAAIFGFAALYPFLEAFVGRDHGRHNVLQRPRDAPLRTATGTMAVTFVVTLSLGATDDTTASEFHMPLEQIIWFYRLGCVIFPIVGFFVAYRVCRRLQEHDRLLLQRGIGTGQIRRRPDGTWAEVTRQVDAIGSAQPEPVPYVLKRRPG